MTSNAEITFGSVQLLAPLSAGGDYEIDVCAEETDYGNPVETVAEVASMLMDGSSAVVTRYGNREATLKVRIKGDSLNAVAAGTAALEAEVNLGRNTLTWLPPGLSTASVFDVVYSVLKFDHDDMAEVRVMRYFTLTLVCLPFARRAELTTVVAEPIPVVTPTSTEIDACSSLTGWSAPLGSASIVSGNLYVTGSTWSAERTGLAVSVGSESYLTVDVSGPLTPALSPYLPVGPNGWANGVSLAFVTAESISGGFRCYFVIPPSITTINTVAFSGGAASAMTLFSVGKRNLLPVTGTRKQRSFSLTVGGTARTAVDLVVEAEARLGGDVVLYTADDGSARAPSMRPWRTSSDSPTTDTDRVSGAYHTFTAPSVYLRPVTVTPPGTYLMLAFLAKTGGSADVTFTWAVELSGHAFDSASPSDGGSVTVPLTATYKFFELGVVSLPPAGISATSDAFIEFTLSASAATARIDDFWLVNLDTGVLSRVGGLDPTVAGPSKFEARSATIDFARPGWVIGSAGTSDDDLEVPQLVKSAGVHDVPPGESDVFIITTAAETQTVTANLYERFRHHVPPKSA